MSKRLKLFNKEKTKEKSVPQSYKPVLEAQEVIDLFSLEINVGGDTYMGYELDYDVIGAIISAHE